eukprot:6412826-Amphidinium_carterae.1
MTTYLNSVFHGMHPPKEAGPRNTAELKMLANTIDELSNGNLPRVADLLMQRYKAVEAVATGQSWEEAKHLEVGRSDWRVHQSSGRGDTDEGCQHAGPQEPAIACNEALQPTALKL